MTMKTSVSHRVCCVSLEQNNQRQDTASASASISCSFHLAASSLINLEFYQSFPQPIMLPLSLSTSFSAFASVSLSQDQE